MCDPMLSGSTLLIPDTPAVREVLRPRCFDALTVDPARIIPHAMAATGYAHEQAHPGVYLVTPRSERPEAETFEQLWEVFAQIAPHALQVGNDGRPPRIRWEYPGSRDPFEWIIRHGEAVSSDAAPDGSFDHRHPHAYQYTQQRVETWTETMEVTGEQAARWFADPAAPTESEIDDARAHFMDLPRYREFIESEQCVAGTVTVIED